MQVTAVDRVLRNGPDEGSGDPAAEGILSVDLRPRPLPWLLARRFKHIADIIEGVERVRATLSLVDDGAKLEGELTAKSTESAEKAMKFLAILRDNVQDPKYVELMQQGEARAGRQARSAALGGACAGDASARGRRRRAVSCCGQARCAASGEGQARRAASGEGQAHAAARRRPAKRFE